MRCTATAVQQDSKTETFSAFVPHGLPFQYIKKYKNMVSVLPLSKLAATQYEIKVAACILVQQPSRIYS